MAVWAVEEPTKKFKYTLYKNIILLLLFITLGCLGSDVLSASRK